MDYNAIAEVDVSPTENRWTHWVDALAPYSPAIGRTDRGISEIVITLPAHNLDQAVHTAWSVLIQAAGQLCSFAVMSTAEYDRRQQDVPMPDLIGATEAAEILGVSRQRIAQMAHEGTLPGTKVGNSLAFPVETVERIRERASTGGKTVRAYSTLPAKHVK